MYAVIFLKICPLNLISFYLKEKIALAIFVVFLNFLLLKSYNILKDNFFQILNLTDIPNILQTSPRNIKTTHYYCGTRQGAKVAASVAQGSLKSLSKHTKSDLKQAKHFKAHESFFYFAMTPDINPLRLSPSS